jgi:hypothetical protein
MVFKLMLCSKGNGFSKSQGTGQIMLRCENPLRDPMEGSFSFKIIVGEETYGPATHDFYSHPVADMPNKPVCKFRRAVDPHSKKVLVRCEIWSGWEAPGKDWSSGESIPSSDSVPSNIQSPDTFSQCSGTNDPSTQGTSGLVSRHPAASQRLGGMGRRGRSEGGRQNQYERWQRRKQERHNVSNHARVSEL